MIHILQEDEGEMAVECQELIRELGFDGDKETVDKFMEGLGELEQLCPEDGKVQHFLNTLIQAKRLRQWVSTDEEVGNMDEESERMAERRELLRKMLVMRGNKETGYAGNWLNAIPSEALGMKMSRAVFLVALTWWLGGRMWQAETCEVRTAKGEKCGKRLDSWGDHAVSCKVGPGVIARHNGVNLAWLLAEKAAGYTVQREQRVQCGSKKKPADTLVWGWRGADACAQDWAVVHPMTKSGLSSKKLDPYTAVCSAEARKRRAESAMCEDAGVEFLPLAMDTFGGFGPSAAAALEVVANQMRTLKGEEEEEKGYKAKRLAQKLRVWMLKFLARQVLSRSAVGKLEEEEEMEEMSRTLAGLEDGGLEDLDVEEVTCCTREEGEEGEKNQLLNEEHRKKGARETNQPQVVGRGGEMRRKKKKQKGRKVKPKRKLDQKLGVNIRNEWMRSQGLERWDVGQGRGGECQFLSVLANTDADAWWEEGKKTRWDYEKVDELRGRVADWLERNQDQYWVGGMSLKESILAEMDGLASEEDLWVEYLQGVRDSRRRQWGDEGTLLALSGVTGRPIITLTGRSGEIPRVEEHSPPESWESVRCSRAPIILTHETDYHYTPVRIQEVVGFGGCGGSTGEAR